MGLFYYAGYGTPSIDQVLIVDNDSDHSVRCLRDEAHKAGELV